MTPRSSVRRRLLSIRHAGIAVLLLATGCWSSPSPVQPGAAVEPSATARDDNATNRPDKTLPLSNDPAVAALASRVSALGGKVRRYRIEPPTPSASSPAVSPPPAADPSKVYVELNFDDAKAVRDADIAAIAEEPGFQAVTNVMLRGTGITDEGMKRLAQAKNLEMIDLSNTQVTDAGLAQLAGHPSLSYLMFDGSSISDEAADRLLRTLPALKGKWAQ